MADSPPLRERPGARGPAGVKLSRDLSGEEVCRALKRLGFEFTGQTGSHKHYEKSGLHPCVPMHREIKPKTLQSILKQANLSIEQLMENL